MSTGRDLPLISRIQQWGIQGIAAALLWLKVSFGWEKR